MPFTTTEGISDLSAAIATFESFRSAIASLPPNPSFAQIVTAHGIPDGTPIAQLAALCDTVKGQIAS